MSIVEQATLKPVKNLCEFLKYGQNVQLFGVWYGRSKKITSGPKKKGTASWHPLPAPGHTVSPLPLWEGERGEKGRKEVTSTLTTASLCLLKAHKSPPSRASFWCCRLPSCRTARASGCRRPGRRAGSAGRQASTGPRARTQVTYFNEWMNSFIYLFNAWHSLRLHPFVSSLAPLSNFRAYCGSKGLATPDLE